MPKALLWNLCPWSQSFLSLHGGLSLLHGQRACIAFTDHLFLSGQILRHQRASVCLLQLECHG